jgi:PAS domain S-box-containing protein
VDEERAYQSSESSRSSLALLTGLLPPFATLLISAVALAWLLSSPSHLIPQLAWLIMAIVVLAALNFTMALRQQLCLVRVHQKILGASEGILDPIPTRPTHFDYSSQVATDYNHMILTLKATFRTLDRCQNQVAQERNHVEALLQSFPGALLNIDHDLRVQSINKQSIELFAYFPGKLIGTQLFDLLQIKPIDKEIIEEAIQKRSNLMNHQLSVSVNGQNRWYSIYLAFVDEPKQEIDIILVIHDTTKFVQLQQAVSQREKFTAMGQVAAGVAHELNTPLGNILGYSQLLQENVDNKQEQEHYIHVISEEARRCSRIVSDLLNFARRDKCDGETCNLNNMVRTMIESFISCRLRHMKIELTLNLSQQDITVEGSCGELEIVLTNLLENATQALDKTPEPKISIETTLRGKEAHLIVSDNGPGVPEDIRQRIFEPFFTTKDIGSGSGLGLSITQSILNKRGASISLESGTETGSHFQIRLPATRDSSNPEEHS